ncbi:dTDP-4-dehydrorhamnose 3,5-epimerase [Acidocella sp.]|uniref:dTDP-4-dehydrorhamnose 3,5-epimerase n=1 Tax=Acidocella sp. TaxID=50710 RepID=UPI003D0703C9
MKIERLAIPDIWLITPPKFGDSRGFFSETWSASKLKDQGFDEHFVQDNQSLSAQKGTIRGLHCQVAPHAQGKLVRVTKGAIWDVAVDIRQGSPSFGKWVAAELSEENWAQLWIPPGFLHGFCTLSPNTEVIYKVTGDYAKMCERAVRWNDPTLALPWPVTAEAAHLSDKDQAAPLFDPRDHWFDHG